MTIRERTERLERDILSPYASRSSESRGRLRPEPPDPIRTCFQADRDRVGDADGIVEIDDGVDATNGKAA